MLNYKGTKSIICLDYMGVKRGLSLQELKRRIYFWSNYDKVLSGMFRSKRWGGEYYMMNLER